MRAIAVLMGWGVCISGVAAEEAATQAPPQTAPALGLIANGQKVFDHTCSNQYCHGPGGAGGQGPRLTDRPMTPEVVRSTIRSGRPGTPMLSFEDVLDPQQLDAVTAYVLSISSEGKLPVVVASTRGIMRSPEPSIVDTGPDEHGPRAAGIDMFFDSTRLSSCHTCHSYHKRGGPLGPDLADEHGAAQEIIASLSEPRRPSPRYPVITVTTKDGTRITGIRCDDTGDTVRLFDVTVPPVLRTFQKSEVVTVQSVDTGSFDHTALGYTPQQVQDLAASLGTP